MPYQSDIEIAQSVTPAPIEEIAASLGLSRREIELYGDYKAKVVPAVMERLRERPDGSLTDIEANIICERESHKGIIIGKQGAMLKKIGSEARADIEKMLDGRVNLKLWVKVRKDWRDSDILMKNYGYDKKDLS